MNAKWLRRTLWSLGFAALWLKVLDDPPLATGGYVQDVTPSAATVAMITGTSVALQCSLVDGNRTVVATRTDERPRRRHAFRFEGLAAGAGYTYAITAVDGGATVADGAVRTAPGDDRAPVRFAFLGDSGAQPWWVWLQRMPAWHLPARWHWLPCARAVSGIGAAVAQWQPDFVLHLGDVVYPEGLHAHYSTGYFRPFAAAMRNAPFYAVLGNHDVVDVDGLQLLGNLRMPAGEVTGDARFLSFAWGPVRVVLLDCNKDREVTKYDASHPGAAFLARELANCSEPWIVVASHFPMHSQSRQFDRADLLLNLLPLLQEAGVSLYLSGHDHCYQRFGGNDGSMPLVVSGGGGKDLYEVRPGRAVKLASIHHWCSAEVRGGELVITARGLDGSVVDTFSIPLPPPAAMPGIEARNPRRAARIEALRRG